MIESVYNLTNEQFYPNELHNDENMKKKNFQHQQTIHTNITWIMNTTIKKNFQKATSFKHQNYKNKKQRFKWIDVMYTTLHLMLIQSENQSLQNIIKKIQHLHSNLMTTKYFNTFKH